MPAAPTADAPADDGEPPRPRRGVRHRLAEWRRLARIAYRDPEHVPARLTLYGSDRAGADAAAWAARAREERPDVPLAVIAEEIRVQTAQASRINGAVAGTPFLIALVPGYLAYIWQEGLMERRMAALWGHDPGSLDTAAKILVLRGVHRTEEDAREALLAVRDAPPPERPARRRPLRVWVRSVYSLLIFGGFVGAPSEEEDEGRPWRMKAVVGFLAGAAIWVITWVFPVSFMIAMAWGCESHARSLGHRSMAYYGGGTALLEAAQSTDDSPGRTKRDLLRAGLLLLSVAVPIAFVAYADHVRQSTGVNWLGAIGALVAASLVIATTVAAQRR